MYYFTNEIYPSPYLTIYINDITIDESNVIVEKVKQGNNGNLTGIKIAQWQHNTEIEIRGYEKQALIKSILAELDILEKNNDYALTPEGRKWRNKINHVM